MNQGEGSLIGEGKCKGSKASHAKVTLTPPTAQSPAVASHPKPTPPQLLLPSKVVSGTEQASGGWVSCLLRLLSNSLHNSDLLTTGAQQEKTSGLCKSCSAAAAAQDTSREPRGCHSQSQNTTPCRLPRKVNSAPVRPRTPSGQHHVAGSHLIGVHIVLVREVEEGDEDPDALTPQPVAEQVVGHHASHEVLARARPAVEGEHQSPLWPWALQEPLHCPQDNFFGQMLPVELPIEVCF